MLATLACPLALALAPVHLPDAAGDEVRVVARRVEPERGGSYLELLAEGLEFVPWDAQAGPAGELFLAGTLRVFEHGSFRDGFGVLKLDTTGQPIAAFGRKFGGESVGLAFVPVPDAFELGTFVGAAVQAAAKPGQERLVLACNATRTASGAKCVVLARIALDDGKPERLAGELALGLGFGAGLDGRSLACGLAVDEHGITIAGDRDGDPGFARLRPDSGEPDPGFGELGEGGVRSGKLMVPVPRFANPAYRFDSGIDAFAGLSDGGIFAAGHLVAANREEKGFQMLLWVTPDGRPNPGFGIESVDRGEAHRLGATTLFYRLPESGAIPVDLALSAVVHVGAVDGDAELFAGLGTFTPPAGTPLCAMNLWKLRPDTEELSARRDWKLESQIWGIDAHGLDPARTVLTPVALLREAGGQLMVVVRDQNDRLLASRHDVLADDYPDAERDLLPWYDEDLRHDLLYGLPASPVDVRTVCAMQTVGDTEYLVVARIASSDEPLLLRRFDALTGDPDGSW